SQILLPVTAAPSQRPPAQGVPAGYSRQAPCPSHMPSVPHDVASDLGHWAESRGSVPSGTNEQLPGPCGRSPALQALSQRTPQQRPSTQNALTHWRSSPQREPLARFTPSAPPGGSAMVQATTPCLRTVTGSDSATCCSLPM